MVEVAGGGFGGGWHDGAAERPGPHVGRVRHAAGAERAGLGQRLLRRGRRRSAGRRTAAVSGQGPRSAPFGMPPALTGPASANAFSGGAADAPPAGPEFCPAPGPVALPRTPFSPCDEPIPNGFNEPCPPEKNCY